MRKFYVMGALVAAVLIVGGACAWAQMSGARAPVVAPAGTVAAAPVAVSATVPPAAPTKAQLLMVNADDRVEGGMMAPVTIIEYASLTCSHCADFNKTTYPSVKKEWIDTGKAKYVLRDMPWDNLALGMSKVARCAPADQFKPLVDTFFAQQEKIMTGKDPLAAIKDVAKMAGFSGEQVDACIKDPDIHAKVTASKDNAFNILEVRGTPTLFVNGTVVNGAVPYKDLQKVLDAEYAKAKK